MILEFVKLKFSEIYLFAVTQPSLFVVRKQRSGFGSIEFYLFVCRRNSNRHPPVMLSTKTELWKIQDKGLLH